MQPLERIRVGGRRDLWRLHGCVEGPERHREAVTLISAWLHSRVRSGNRALGVGELSSKVDFERRNLMPYMGDSSKDVAWKQTQGELVRVLHDDHVVNCQGELFSSRDGSGHRRRDV